MKAIVLSVAFATVTFGAYAQTTPEAIIGQCPDLPSAATLAAAANDSESAAYKAVNEFMERINALGKRIDTNVAPDISEAELAQAVTNTKKEAEKQAQAVTGKSLAELQNMSETELQALGEQAAEKALQQQMSAAGMGNLSLADMQNMSEDQLMARVAANSGLTADEMKAMQGMSEKQIEAYMKQGDRMQRVQNSPAAKAAANSTRTNQPALSEAEMNALQKAPEEQQKFLERINEMEELHQNEHRELAAQFQTIHAKHRGTASYQQASKIASDCGGKTIYTNAQCEAAYATLKAAHTACDTECYALWRNQIAKQQGRYKTLLTDAARVDALQEQSAKAQTKLHKNAMSGIASKTTAARINSYSVANAYLAAAASVTVYPQKEN